jgi:phage/plasmid-like protein (TIGR03299 family)
MAHQLETNSKGEAKMFYAGETPWHRLGTRVDKEVTAAAAIKLAGLDWKVEKRPLYIAGKSKVDGIPVIGNQAEDRFAIVRAEDDKVLGTVGSAYTPIQNEEAFAFLDALVGEGLTMFHTAGSLFGGRRVFITCKLPDSVHVGPDQIDKYLALANAHDGSMKLHLKWTPIRIVCWNTLSAAFNLGASGKVRFADNKSDEQDMVSIMHRPNYRDYLAEARELLKLTDVYYARMAETFNKLRETKLRDCDWTRFANRLIPDGENKEKGKKSDRGKQRDLLTELYRHGAGNDHPDVAGTKWAAYNAVTEYVDHTKDFSDGEKGDAVDYRMASLVWGTGSTMKKKALDMLTVS